jgi:hypothetical protein
MSRQTSLLSSAVVAALIAVGPAGAQQGMGPEMMMGPGGAGAMMGPGHGMMMGGRGPDMMMGGCPMMGARDGDAPQTFAEGRIAFLKAELAITDAQEGAWKAYADALRKNLAGMQGMHAKMMAMMGAKTPVERLDAHVAAMEGRLQALKDMKPTLSGLYALLSDEQKKKADALLTGMGCMM